MSEVSINRRVFVQPSRVLAYLEGVVEDLPNVSLHPLEPNSPHELWTFSSALELMHRASDASTGVHRLWTDFTFGERVVFLPYDARSDSFVACSGSSPKRFSCAEARGGVGSEARETRRKQHRDLDAVSPTPAFVGSNPFQPTAPAAPVEAPNPTPTVPPIPPMDPVVLKETPEPEVRYLQVSPSEVSAIPELSRALGSWRDRPWAVGELLTTLSTWFLTRNEDARRRGGERDRLASELQRVQEELRRSREDSLHRVNAYECASFDRDRYRGERDALRGGWATVARDSGMLLGTAAPVRREAPRDPYAPISSYGDADKVPRHPGYCPPDPYESAPAGAFPQANP